MQSAYKPRMWVCQAGPNIQGTSDVGPKGTKGPQWLGLAWLALGVVGSLFGSVVGSSCLLSKNNHKRRLRRRGGASRPLCGCLCWRGCRDGWRRSCREGCRRRRRLDNQFLPIWLPYRRRRRQQFDKTCTSLRQNFDKARAPSTTLRQNFDKT